MTDTNMAAIRAAAQALVHQAELAGVVVTIETVPMVAALAVAREGGAA